MAAPTLASTTRESVLTTKWKEKPFTFQLRLIDQESSKPPKRMWAAGREKEGHSRGWNIQVSRVEGNVFYAFRSGFIFTNRYTILIMRYYVTNTFILFVLNKKIKA